MRHLFPAVAVAVVCAGCVAPPPLPPPPLIAQLAATTPAATADCRDYRAQGTVDGARQPVLGRACRQTDGTWRMEGDIAPLPAISELTTQVAPDNPYCRDYSAMAIDQARRQPVVGRVCELADGSWQVTQGTPEQPAQVNILFPPPRYPYPYPYYADYGPWPWWGAGVGLGASFIVGGHGGHHHGGGHHQGGHHGGAGAHFGGTGGHFGGAGGHFGGHH